MTKVIKQVVYIFHRLHLEFMSTRDMFNYIYKNKFRVHRSGDDYVLLTKGGKYINHPKRVYYKSPEDCVIAILKYNRDYSNK